MKLLIIKENFDIKRILFRESKTSIKISYDINYVSMIGITINISYENLVDRDTYIIIKIHPEDLKLFTEIDSFFNKKVQNYQKIMINGNIKVKKHNEYRTNSEKTISITMNSIKKDISGKNKVQIFSI